VGKNTSPPGAVSGGRVPQEASRPMNRVPGRRPRTICGPDRTPGDDGGLDCPPDLARTRPVHPATRTAEGPPTPTPDPTSRTLRRNLTLPSRHPWPPSRLPLNPWTSHCLPVHLSDGLTRCPHSGREAHSGQADDPFGTVWREGAQTAPRCQAPREICVLRKALDLRSTSCENPVSTVSDRPRTPGAPSRHRLFPAFRHGPPVPSAVPQGRPPGSRRHS
jgi:hypothetical protein